jgi:hypothetical protein
MGDAVRLIDAVTTNKIDLFFANRNIVACRGTWGCRNR